MQTALIITLAIALFIALVHYFFHKRPRYLGDSRLKLHSVGEVVVSNGKKFIVTHIVHEAPIKHRPGSTRSLPAESAFKEERYCFYGLPLAG
jgi:hypothetical protein